MRFGRLLAVCAASVLPLAGAAPAVELPEAADLSARATQGSPSLLVDLGYARYNGTYNSTTEIRSWMGIRYARNTSETRWQPPKPPHKDRKNIIQANTPPYNCPSGTDSPPQPGYNFTGSEDCLFVNVVSPKNAKDLPVLLWIHGGGYGQGNGGQDLTEIMTASNNGFVGIAIQYRLAAFGFLSSADVQKHGVPNAGLYDQQFAIKWAQQYIHMFGGDPNHVTIAGESAGGGSVMLQVMAMGGSLGDSLFRNGIAASPYLPTQPSYNDEGPTHNYLLFAQTVGCYSGSLDAPDVDELSRGSIFKCLVSKDTETLQNASSYVSSSVLYGQWAFIPVTDGHFVQNLPSQQLESGKLNGRHIMTGNNADEGVGFTPQNITTEADFENFARTIFPRFSEADLQTLVDAYPSTAAPVNPNALNFSTAGDSGPTALNQSTFGTGQQQRANNLYAEATFVCPSYWMADGFSKRSGAYHYQYSVVGADHGSDVQSYFGPPRANLAPSYMAIMMGIWYHMVEDDNPSIPDCAISSLENFPQWYPGPTAKMMDLNETGGTPYMTYSAQNLDITQYEEPGIQLDIREVDAYSWEGGRGKRCDVLRSLGPKIPA